MLQSVLYGIYGNLGVFGYYFILRGLLTLGDSVMDKGVANAKNETVQFKNLLQKNWRLTRDWPIKWAEMMF